MSSERRDVVAGLEADVIVIGGGLAGLASAIHLTRGGLKVICLEPRETFGRIVGESLDWSAPDLLARLGLPMEELVKLGAATYKRHITMTGLDGKQEDYVPGAWLAERPWNVELRTMHLDRRRVHGLVMELVRLQGTTILHERATGFEVVDGRIVAVETSGGRVLRSRWIVDASGAAAGVLRRKFELKAKSYGPRKIALWAHFHTEDWVEGTTLYTLSDPGEYMEWLWEIPVRPGVSSIGYVAPGWKAKREKAAGLSNEEMLFRQMLRFPRLQEIAERSVGKKASATSFLCRTFDGVCGSNWIIVGEAASQSDPITGNGVTAALRHAEEGSALICRHHSRGVIPARARWFYNMRVLGMGRFFNSLIEKLYYAPPFRSLAGVFLTTEVYTVPAWTANVVYSRTRPRGVVGTVVFCGVLTALRGAAWVAFKLSTLFRGRRTPGPVYSDTSAGIKALGAGEEQLMGEGDRHALHSSR